MIWPSRGRRCESAPSARPESRAGSLSKKTKDMLALAKHIVSQAAGHFVPETFEDHHETALIDPTARRQADHSEGAARCDQRGRPDGGAAEVSLRSE